jgi:hypothetical protein
MPTINQLPVLNVISSGDQLPVYSPNNGDARRASIGSLLTFFQQSFASPTLSVNLFVPGNGFNITVPTPVSNDQWMLLQPAGTLATGTITLPLNTGVPDGTSVLITTTQEITSLTIALNGATALYGGVTTLSAGTATAIRFYQPTNSWYQINAETTYAAGMQAWLANPTSANLRAAMTDETGTGLLVFNNTPTDMLFNGLTIGRGLTSAATNTALGISTLGAVTTAVQCTAVGASALASNTTASRNTAVGDRALTTNTIGGSNVAVGANSLDTNLSGNFNVAVGRSALLDNSTGTNNVAVGGVALSNNITGNSNVAIGMDSLFTNTSSTGNIGIGFASLYTSNSGTSNIAIGGSSLYSNTSGFNNIAVGIDAMFTNTTGDGCVAIGFNALKLNLSGEENVAVGFEALTTNSTGIGNTAVGFQSGYGITTGSSNTYIGYVATQSGVAVTNEIVVGALIIGKGSNTAFIGGTAGAYNGANASTWNVTSDVRIKKNVVSLKSGLSVISSLRPVEFDYIKDDKHDIGFIAQEYKEVLPEQITEDSDGMLSLTQNLVPYLVKAIQELKAELDAYKANQESKT